MYKLSHLQARINFKQGFYVIMQKSASCTENGSVECLHVGQCIIIKNVEYYIAKALYIPPKLYLKPCCSNKLLIIVIKHNKLLSFCVCTVSVSLVTHRSLHSLS